MFWVDSLNLNHSSSLLLFIFLCATIYHVNPHFFWSHVLHWIPFVCLSHCLYRYWSTLARDVPFAGLMVGDMIAVFLLFAGSSMCLFGFSLWLYFSWHTLVGIDFYFSAFLLYGALVLCIIMVVSTLSLDLSLPFSSWFLFFVLASDIYYIIW